MDWLSIISGVSSIVLALVAIWLSWLFFTHANKSSKDTEVAVNKISEATGTLSKLSMRLINQLTTALVENNRATGSLATVTKEANEEGNLPFSTQATNLQVKHWSK